VVPRFVSSLIFRATGVAAPRGFRSVGQLAWLSCVVGRLWQDENAVIVLQDMAQALGGWLSGVLVDRAECSRVMVGDGDAVRGCHG